MSGILKLLFNQIKSNTCSILIFGCFWYIKNKMELDKKNWKCINLINVSKTMLFNIFSLVIVVCHFSMIKAQYDVPMEVLSVTTFNDCNAVDQSIQSIVCLPNKSMPVTAIRINVIPGQSDTEGDRELDFFGFPQPLGSNNPVNTQTQAQSNTCLDGNPSVNCSIFVNPDTGNTGPIRVQIDSGNLVSRYNMRKMNFIVPYAYLDHNKGILQCTFDEPPVTGTTSENNMCKKATAYHQCRDNQPLLNPWLFTASSDGSHSRRIGIDPTASCRGVNDGDSQASSNTELGKLIAYQKNQSMDWIPVPCFACPIPINQPYVVNFSISNPSVNGPSSFSNYFTTRGSLCPIPNNLQSKGPTTKAGIYDGSAQMYDADTQEPAYFWCFANNFGLKSDDITRYGNLDSPTAKGTGDGTYYDIWTEWGNAYACTITTQSNIPGNNNPSSTTCPQLVTANILDGGGTDPSQICCGTALNCPTPTPVGSVGGCNGTATAQVYQAINYITASCNADETGENLYTQLFSEGDLSWTCPGSFQDYVRPNRPEDPFWLARCSAGCQSRPTITQATYTDKDKGQIPSNRNEKEFIVEAVLKDKGSIFMGGPQCDVYQVDPKPHAIVNISVTITAPNGEYVVQKLGTDQRTFVQSNLTGVIFSTRINRIELVLGSTGPDISGLIVVCGTRDNNQVPAISDSIENCNGAFIDKEFNLNPKDGECNVPEGVLRGVFPSGLDADGYEIPGDPTVNPWPQLINKYVKDYSKNCGCSDPANCNGNFESNYCTPLSLQGAQYGCGVPFWKYLGVLNCARRVAWYFVNEFNQANYGQNCGQLGFSNNFASSQGGATFMCQQGENTCTPGYGRPRYDITGTGYVRSPCQEIGTFVNFSVFTSSPNFTSTDESRIDPSGEFCERKDKAQPQNLPPGWTWDTLPTLEQGDNIPVATNVPNYWVNGIFIYRKPSTAEQGVMSIDLEIYTDTFYGMNIETFTPGNLTEEDGMYCQSAIDESGSGEIPVLVCNTSPFYGGSYQLSAVCTTSSQVALDPGPNPQEFQLGANECAIKTFSLSASGPLELSTAVCNLELREGGSSFALLSALTIQCDITVPQLITFSRSNLLGPQGVGCGKYDLFCQLSQANPFEQWIIYIWIIFFFFISIVYSVAVADYTINAKRALKAQKQLYITSTEVVVAKEQQHIQRQAELTASLIKQMR